MLSVRGEAVLSWADEDSFVVDDKATSGHEVHDLMHFCHFLRSTGSFFEDFSCIVRGSFIVKRTCSFETSRVGKDGSPSYVVGIM